MMISSASHARNARSSSWPRSSSIDACTSPPLIFLTERGPSGVASNRSDVTTPGPMRNVFGRSTGLATMGTVARWVALAALAFFAQLANGADSDTAVAGPPPLAPGDARICFYRETWHALSVQPDVTIAGQVVGKAFPNEWFCVDRKPGSYDISTQSEPDHKF